MSSISTCQIDLQESNINITKIIIELFQIYKPLALSKGVNLKLDKNIPLMPIVTNTDISEIKKVIESILNNTIKHTNEGWIEIGINRTKNNINIYIQNTGVGIEKENQKIIFVSFSQECKDLSRKVGGLGLGLSIAKEYIELLNGHITLDSDKGKGSLFNISIPIHYTEINNRGIMEILNKT